jgi:hypothetical protein
MSPLYKRWLPHLNAAQIFYPPYRRPNLLRANHSFSFPIPKPALKSFSGGQKGCKDQPTRV